MIVMLYKSPPDIPSGLPHLTTDNHTAFYESNTKAVVIFYYHCKLRITSHLVLKNVFRSFILTKCTNNNAFVIMVTHDIVLW